MITVDIGNSRFHAVVFDGARVCGRAELPVKNATPDSVRQMLHDALSSFLVCPLDGEGGIVQTVTDCATVRSAKSLSVDLREAVVLHRRIAVSSVVPAANETLVDAARTLGLAVEFIAPATHDIMPHRLPSPATTGADRLLAVRAAWEMHFRERGAGGVVVQCGTAATVDVVGRDGVFWGGMILPGPGLWLSSLGEGAALLPTLAPDEMEDDAPVCGVDTRSAIAAGLRHGYFPGVVSAILAARAYLGSDVLVVIGGGWASRLAARLDFPAVVVRDLVAHGIRVVASGVTPKPG